MIGSRPVHPLFISATLPPSRRRARTHAPAHSLALAPAPARALVARHGRIPRAPQRLQCGCMEAITRVARPPYKSGRRSQRLQAPRANAGKRSQPLRAAACIAEGRSQRSNCSRLLAHGAVYIRCERLLEAQVGVCKPWDRPPTSQRVPFEAVVIASMQPSGHVAADLRSPPGGLPRLASRALVGLASRPRPSHPPRPQKPKRRFPFGRPPLPSFWWSQRLDRPGYCPRRTKAGVSQSPSRGIEAMRSRSGTVTWLA